MAGKEKVHVDLLFDTRTTKMKLEEILKEREIEVRSEIRMGPPNSEEFKELGQELLWINKGLKSYVQEDGLSFEMKMPDMNPKLYKG